MVQVITKTSVGIVYLNGLLTEEQCEKAVLEGRMSKARPQVYESI